MRPRVSKPQFFRRLLPPALWAALLAAPGCSRPADGKDPAEVASSATPVAVRTGPHALGELGRAPDFTMSIDAVRDCHVPQQAAPRRGYVRVGLDVTLEGTSEREVPANPFYASLRDASGEVYAGTLTGCDPPLPAVRLRRGAKARGHLNFDVSKTAVTLELRYAPPIIGQTEDEEIRFALRR